MKTMKLASVSHVGGAILSSNVVCPTDPGVRSNTGVNAGQPLAFCHRIQRLGLLPNRTCAVQTSTKPLPETTRPGTTLQP